eukprot:918684-Rhodomonas_salina.1
MSRVAAYPLYQSSLPAVPEQPTCCTRAAYLLYQSSLPVYQSSLPAVPEQPTRCTRGSPRRRSPPTPQTRYRITLQKHFAG